MAQGGGNQQQPYIYVPITIRVDSSSLQSFVEGDRYYGNQIQTNIIDSNIGQLIAGNVQPAPEHPDPGDQQQGPDEPGDQGDDNFNVAEEMQQMNLESNPEVPKTASRGSEKSTFSMTVSRASQTVITGDFNVAEETQNVTDETQQLDQASNRPETESEQTSTSSGTAKKPSFFRSLFIFSQKSEKDVNLNYKKSAKLLEKVIKLQQESDLYTMLQLTECYLHLGRNEEANETIGKVRSMIMTSQTLCANDIKTLAKDLAGNSAHTRAMILFPIACDMFHANASSPDDAVNRMYECIKQMYFSVKALVNDSEKPRQIVASGIRYQEQMYESLSSVKNAKPEKKVLKQAWAVCYIGNNYGSVGEHEKKLKLLLSNVELLQQHFNGKESMYQIYGQLLNNIGAAYDNLDNFTEAEKYLVKSVDATTEATDYPSESEKQEIIERSKNNLKIVRIKLGK